MICELNIPLKLKWCEKSQVKFYDVNVSTYFVLVKIDFNLYFASVLQVLGEHLSSGISFVTVV